MTASSAAIAPPALGPTASGAASGPVSGLLARLAGAGDRTLGALLAAMGEDARGLGVVLVGAATLIPGIAPLFAIVLGCLGWGVARGRAAVSLPQLLAARPVASRHVARAAALVGRRAGWLERRLRPRRPGMISGAGRVALGAALMVDAVLIALPIPFGNTAPALAGVVIGLGLVGRDGTVALAGLFATGLALLLDATLVGLGAAGLLALAAQAGL